MGKQYDKSFKEEIVKKILHEKSSVPDIAEQYGLVLQTVYKWVRTYKDSGFHGSGRNKNSTENYIRKLEEENKILRKIRHLEKGTDAAFEFIHQHRSQFSVSTMCALLEVSSSGFYKWSKDIKSDQEINQHILMRKTKELYIKHKTKVGSPRLTELLKEQGVEASTATISRILRENKRKWGTEYTAYKNKMRLVTDKDTGEVTVVFPYKDNVWDHQTGTLYHEELAGDEIEERFSNNQLINFKKHTADGTQAISMLDTNDNLLLKGDNLHALHTLREQYKRKVKLIYIDPPYNTQNYKLSYNDSFEDNLYLTFLKNRLDVAIDFLKEDGSIFIHCNVHQQAHIRLLCDEIFGRDNFITQLI